MAPLLCRPADRTLGPLNTHFFPLLEMSIRNNDFSNGSLVVCWFLSGGFFLGVFYSFTFFFFPLFLFLLLFGDPLRTRVVMTFLLTHLHSPHFVLDSFLLFLEKKKTKRNQAKNGFKLPKLQCRLWGYVRASTLKLLSGPS